MGRTTVRTAATLTGLAAAATGITVGAGVLNGPVDAPLAAHIAGASDSFTLSPEALALREEQRAAPQASRSDRRGTTDPAKAAALTVDQGPTVTRQVDLSTGDPRDVARALLPLYGFDDSQFSCLDSLYVSESNWRVNADNPSSSAYGIPQALTATHDLPAGYMTSAEVQIRWGLDYIKSRYGTPCSAWSFKRARGWY